MNKKYLLAAVAAGALILVGVWAWFGGAGSLPGAGSGGGGDVLAFTPGPVGNSSTLPAGSWFAVELVPQMMVYTGLQPGPDGGIVIGKPQRASGSHAGDKNGSEAPGLDAPWVFFSCTGMHYTVGGGIVRTDAGSLDFKSWRWAWNGVEEINLGEGGQATFVWSGTYGEPFKLDYTATIPAGDPSGFGGSKYVLHLEGMVRPPNTAGPVAQSP